MVTLDYSASDYGGEIQSVAGNNVGYGATGGTIFVGGRAGHRLGIRNSGATIVAGAKRASRSGAMAPNAMASATFRFARRASAMATAMKMWVNQSTTAIWAAAQKDRG